MPVEAPEKFSNANVILDSRNFVLEKILGILVLENLKVENSRSRSILDFFASRRITNSDVLGCSQMHFDKGKPRFTEHIKYLK